MISRPIHHRIGSVISPSSADTHLSVRNCIPSPLITEKTATTYICSGSRPPLLGKNT